MRVRSSSSTTRKASCFKKRIQISTTSVSIGQYEAQNLPPRHLFAAHRGRCVVVRIKSGWPGQLKAERRMDLHLLDARVEQPRIFEQQHARQVVSVWFNFVLHRADAEEQNPGRKPRMFKAKIHPSFRLWSGLLLVSSRESCFRWKAHTHLENSLTQSGG